MSDLSERLCLSPEGESGLPRWFRTVFGRIGPLGAGQLDIALPDGRVFRVAGTAPGPAGRIDIRDTRLFGRLVREGDMAFGDAYLDGWWDTPDLQALLDLVLLNIRAVADGLRGNPLLRGVEKLRHWLRSNTRRQARENISYHYDLGNAFYALWLDPSMTYSSALFHGRQESLEAGQRNKYAAMCDALDLAPGAHVLEIGCGWGGFAEYAAAERGLRVTGITLSREQAGYARARLERAGLADRTEILIRDYRDVGGSYDGIASIEMIEAVGTRYWPVYFETLRARLVPGGRASVQAITMSDELFARYRQGVDFIQKHVFPGGMLPSPRVLASEIAAAGLDALDTRRFGDSYDETLRRWHTRFNDRWEEVRALGFDDRFRRMWNFYLTSCAAAFRAGNIDVAQVTMRRPA